MALNQPSVGADRKQFYSTTHGPFHNANNIYLFFGGGARGQLVDNCIRAISDGDTSVTIAGERGSGKTMFSLVLAERLQHRHNIIRYDHPDLNLSSVLRHLLIEICPQSAQIITKADAVNGASSEVHELARAKIQEALLGPLPGDKPYLLIIDASMPCDELTNTVLQELSALQTYGQRVLQFVLLEPCDDQGSAHATPADSENLLRRLNLAEISEYLHHHMLLFDFNRRYLFTREMAYFIADRSDGVFRSINNLARNAFMIASLEDADRLSMSHLLMAGLPTPPKSPLKANFLVRHRRGLVTLFGVGIIVSMAAVIALI